MSFELFCATEYTEYHGGLKSLFTNCHSDDRREEESEKR